VIYEDAAVAQALLEMAIGTGSTPDLPADRVALLLTMAESVAPGGHTVWTSEGLNRSVAMAWRWKAALTADQYKLGGGPGIVLESQQWHQQCMNMAHLYSSGEWSVDDLSPDAVNKDDEGEPFYLTFPFLGGGDGSGGNRHGGW
jgi:hypothetical protein